MNFLFGFASETAIHGIGHIGKKKSFMCNLLWIVLALTGFVAVIVFSIQIGLAFVAKQMSTDMRVLSQPSLQLPYPLICIKNRFNRTKVRQQNISDLLLIAIMQQSEYNHPFLPEKRILNSTELDRLRPEYDKLIEKFGSYDRLLDELVLKCDDLIENCDKNLLIEYDCCKTATVYDSGHGVCIELESFKQTFASQGIRVKLKFPKTDQLVANVGAIFSKGMVLVLNMNKQSAGGTISSASYSLLPGEHSLVTLDMKKETSIDNPPQYRCNEEKEYNQKQCRTRCYQDDPTYQPLCLNLIIGARMVGSNSSELPTCDPWQTYKAIALVASGDGFLSTANRIIAKCQDMCPKSCTTQSLIVNMLRMPFDAELLETVFNNKSESEFIMNQRGLLDISFKNMEVTTYEQRLSLTLLDVVASMGGYLGLFVGGSLITLVHAIVYTVHHFCLKPFAKIQDIDISKN